jgi:hypothetical protein
VGRLALRSLGKAETRSLRGPPLLACTEASAVVRCQAPPHTDDGART